MKLRNLTVLAVVSLSLFGMAGCKKDTPQNKFIDPLPLRAGEVVVPAYAAQDMMLIRKNLMRTAIHILNRTTTLNPSYPELQGGGPDYTFDIRDAKSDFHATYTIRFFDENNTQVNPVSAQSSSSTVKTVTLEASAGGGTSRFPTLTDSVTLTLQTTNYTQTTPVHLTGNMTLANSDYNVPFAFPSPGCRVNTEGLRDGAISVTGGSGPNGPVTMSLSVSNDHSIDGQITWEGKEGGLHISDSGAGFILTPDARIPLN